ncbi:thioesterase family protein [Amphritea pacifica]|uniref:Thioesterase family protein n=1 Tax=Amphritea pacifica TaxID=2811233 RepID=A0ABS2W2T5_9GAMM|nr:thioesterase family protein [Amphritea pacifica]MBN0986027.1 thioesterase family protein [Amphritea pacifica]
MTPKAPIIYRTRIKPEWLDYNNHMNVAYYVLIFDLAGVELVSQLGLSEAVTEQTGISWMVLENHITYNNEVILDQPVEIRCQLIDHDSKRLHLYFEMYAHTDMGVEYLAATLEQMAMCVDLNSRSSCEFPAGVTEQIDAMAQLQADLPKPANIGRKIGIRRR